MTNTAKPSHVSAQPSGARFSPDTAQRERDRKEKQGHPASENALKSSQDKNPVPPGTTRR